MLLRLRANDQEVFNKWKRKHALCTLVQFVQRIDEIANTRALDHLLQTTLALHQVLHTHDYAADNRGVFWRGLQLVVLDALNEELLQDVDNLDAAHVVARFCVKSTTSEHAESPGFELSDVLD